MTAIAEAELPPGHAGIAAGPLVVRDGDVYGHTVNLAARIAAHAQAGEILVAGDMTSDLDDAGIRWQDASAATLKGLGTIRLARLDLVID